MQLQIGSALVDVRQRVVVIGEDDEPVARLLRDALNDEPAYQAVIVPGGALMLDTVRQVHGDLPILDVMMPGPSAIGVFDRVHPDPDVRNMPVLFATAASQDYQREFRDRTIADVIAKPFDLIELHGKVRSLCPP